MEPITMTTLKHSINPMVDCVFKALLGALENVNLTLNFLNAILKPDVPIQHIEILNPYNEKEFLSDKLTIVDIKVKDTEQRHYQIEVQLAVFSYLPARMLYTWRDIYQSQLGSGDDFKQLKPVVSIWLLGENLFNQSQSHHHHFQAYDPVNKIPLSDHFSIHILELPKWEKKSAKLNKEDQWLCFFQNAEKWNRLPNELDNPEMRQAMQVLTRFSEKEKAYHLYQSRQNALRDEATKKRILEEAECQKEEAIQKMKEAIHQIEEERQQKEEAMHQIEEERQQKEEAILEKERLIALLQKAGIDPNK